MKFRAALFGILAMFCVTALLTSCSKDDSEPENIPANALTGDTVWTRMIGSSADESAFSALETSDHGFIIAGGRWQNNHKTPFLVKTDASGTEQWSWTLDEDSVDIYAIRECSGGYVLVGHNGLGITNLIKIDADGVQQWVRRFELGDPWDLDVMSNGDFVFGGAGNTGQPVLVRTTSSGTLVWSHIFEGMPPARITAVEPIGDGGIVCAFSHGVLVKVSADGTSVLWEQNYSDMRINGMCRAQNGDFALAGHINADDAGSQLVLKRVDSGGAALWTRSFGGGQSEDGRDVVQTADGGFAVAGRTMSYGSTFPPLEPNLWVVKTAANGDSAWAKACGGDGGESGWAIIRTHDNRVLVVGETHSAGRSYDMYAVLLK